MSTLLPLIPCIKCGRPTRARKNLGKKVKAVCSTCNGALRTVGNIPRDVSDGEHRLRLDPVRPVHTIPPVPRDVFDGEPNTRPAPNAPRGTLKVSVVIPSYNRPEMLYRVLYSLWRQQDQNYEVLVSNDDDLDKAYLTEEVTAEFINQGMPVRSFQTGKYKRGRGWSVETYPYNVGIRNATGDVIILNSGDVMSVTDTIRQHSAHHELVSDRVVISTVHAITVNTQTNIDSYDWKNNRMALLFKGSCYKMFSGVGVSFTDAYTHEEAHIPYHFQMSIRKNHLWEIHGFDEDYYGRMACGDDDLAYRLRKKGLKFYWDPNILAIHQYHGSPESMGEGRTADMNKMSGHALYGMRVNANIVRNTAHEWGQYPRDMESL